MSLPGLRTPDALVQGSRSAVAKVDEVKLWRRRRRCSLFWLQAAVIAVDWLIISLLSYCFPRWRALAPRVTFPASNPTRHALGCTY